MATSNQDLAFRSDSDGSADAAATNCGADELKGLLAQLTDQILDADRRHSTALNQMQERLSTFGEEAKSVRVRAPAELNEAFARIEDGMQSLADRIVGPESDRKVRAPVSGMPTGSAKIVSNGIVSNGPAKSSLGSKPAAKSAATCENIESTRSGDAANPWDRDSADALASVYEAVEPGIVSRTPDPEIAPLRTVRAALPDISVGHAPEHASPKESERDWLEAQLSGLTQRLEQSLQGMRPDGSVKALGQRFDAFEDSLGAALEGIATRSDVEALHLIEAHIGELAQHLDSTQSQLGRLDTIESQLQAVVAQLADEREARLAATSAVINVPGLASVATIPGAADDLRSLIEQFVDERRHGDEQTMSMLDTMQQALVQVLDRIDMIEVTQARHPVPAASQDYVREPVSFASEPQHSAESSPDGVAAQEATYAADAAAAVAAMAQAYEPKYEVEAEGSFYAQPRAEAPKQSTPRVVAEPAQAHTQSAAAPEANPKSTVERLRQDFIADAQRAKLKAGIEAAEAAAGKLESPVKAARRAIAPTSPTSIIPGLASTIVGSRTKRLIVGALVAIVAINGALLLMPRKGKGPAAPAAVKTEPKKADSAAKPAAKPAAPGKDAPAGATTDDLGFETETPDAATPKQNVITEGNAVDGAAPKDMSLQNPFSAPLTAELIRLDAAAAAAVTGNGAAPALPAAFGAGEVPAPATGDATAGLRIQSLDLPPATVGPLSLRLAAAKGDPSAEFEVGARLAEGKGTGQNFQEAMRWYQRSATRGFAQAQYRLGTLFERGLGAKADLNRARVWYQRAAEQGNVKAMHNLAVLSAGRASASPDYPTAAQWFSAAAEHDLADSQFNYAVLCEGGLGVAQDLGQAYKWFSLASRSGDGEAVRRRDLLKSKLTPAELAAAEELVRTFEGAPADTIVNDARAAGEDWKKRQVTESSG